jgi:hypothetical protein
MVGDELVFVLCGIRWVCGGRTRVQEPFDHGRGCEVLLFCVKGEFWFLVDPAANI